MNSDASMPLFVFGVLAGGLVLFLVTAVVFLWFGCAMANRIAAYAGKREQIALPTVRHALGTVVGSAIVLSIATGILEPALVDIATFIDEWIVRWVATTLEWIVYTLLVAAGIAGIEKAHNRLALLAATLHTGTLLAAGATLNLLLRAIAR